MKCRSYRKWAGGVEMQAAEAAERNQSVSLHRVKTWPQIGRARVGKECLE